MAYGVITNGRRLSAAFRLDLPNCVQVFVEPGNTPHAGQSVSPF